MANPLITVLIDTYNHEAFIADAIESVLRQAFSPKDVEILVVDDGSTDHTPEIVRRYMPRVQLLRKSNGGQASAFNAGIPAARGEIVAFLDGDDWWEQGKLAAVAEAFAADEDVGLVGHGIIEVHPDGRRRTEVPRGVSRFRIDSIEQAKNFRLQRGFLGTSRMAYRRAILLRMGQVPESLVFEADEYLFTLAGFFAGVVILPEPFTCYRLHDQNLFQLSAINPEGLRRKQRVLSALAHALDAKLHEIGVPADITRVVVECVQVEAEVLRLQLERGFPWETISAERKVMRIFHRDASFQQRLFSSLRLIPALALPSSAYYQWRRRLSLLPIYKQFRKRFLPFPVPSEVDRRDSSAP